MIQLPSNSLIIVTGAANGNGFAISKKLENSGAEIVRVDKSELPQNPNNFSGDVTNEDFIAEVYDFCSTKKFKFIGLVNNAGITLPSEFPYPKSFWDKTIEVNLTAPFLWIETFMPLFIKSANGSIVNITSLGAERAFPNNPSYIASKGGLKMLSKYYAKSLGKNGIRVNNLGPGYIETDMTKSSFSNKKTKINRENHTFLHRWGKPDDVADACCFLFSEESKYITGQDIYVDGGWLSNGLIE